MRILFLGHHLGRRSSGARRRAAGLLSALAESEEAEAALALGKSTANLPGLSPRVRLVRAGRDLETPAQRLLFQDLVLDRLVSEMRPDYVHAEALPVPRQKNLILTIHDLRHLESGPSWRRLAYARVLRRSLVRAARVHAVSAAVRSRLLEWLGRSRVRIDVVANALAPLPAIPCPSEEMAELRPYVAVVGHFEPRKGWETAVETRRILARKGWDIPFVFMGTGEGMPEIPLAALRGEFPRMRRSLVLRGLDDDALFRWMSAASALLAPALEEGFGLVPLEALSLGTPVVASAIPAHQEVLGTCAVYRAPHHAEGFAQALVEVMAREPAEREARSAAGAAWARGLSWSASATAFLGSLRTPT